MDTHTIKINEYKKQTSIMSTFNFYIILYNVTLFCFPIFENQEIQFVDQLSLKMQCIYRLTMLTKFLSALAFVICKMRE